MDKKIEKIIEIGLQMTEQERQRVLDFASYLLWTHTGGTKTAEIERGEKEYHWFEAHYDLTALQCLNMPAQA